MLVNTCLADNLSTLSTFNWGKLQLLNVDFFVYIKLSTFLCQKAVSPCISTLSYVFHKMAFLWKLFYPHYPHFYVAIHNIKVWIFLLTTLIHKIQQYSIFPTTCPRVIHIIHNGMCVFPQWG